MTNVTGLLHACFGIHLTLMFFALLYTKRSVERNVKFGGRFFETRLLSRLSHNLPSSFFSFPVRLRKLTNDVWGTAAAIPYWGRVTTQIWVALREGEILLQPVRSTIQIWVVIRHQHGISTLVIRGQTGGGVANVCFLRLISCRKRWLRCTFNL